MTIELKVKLKAKMQEFLDENCDDIGSNHNIYQDETTLGRDAALMANAAEVVIDAMELQRDIEAELNPE